MNRRELLQAISTFTVNGILAGKIFQLNQSGKKYVIFFDPKLTGPHFERHFMSEHPDCTAYPLTIPDGKTIDDAIRIFSEK